MDSERKAGRMPLGGEGHPPVPAAGPMVEIFVRAAAVTRSQQVRVEWKQAARDKQE